MRSFFIFLITASSVIPSICHSAEVRDWRNGGNGLYPEETIVLDWKDRSKVLWELPTESWSNSSPILIDGRLFIAAEPSTLICVEAASGKVLWQEGNDLADFLGDGSGPSEAELAAAEDVSEKLDGLERKLYRAQRKLKRSKGDEGLEAELAALKTEIDGLKKQLPEEAAKLKKPPANGTNGYSSYTPVTDGQHVWASYGTGVVVCFDLDGKRLWHTRLEAPDHNWGGACSPRLAGGVLVVRFKDYHGLDPKTGEAVWRAPSEGVVFNAAAQFELDGKDYLITPRGELIRPSDGKKLWSAGFTIASKSWSFHNTPSVIGHRVFFAHGAEGQDGDAYCLEMPATAAELEKEGMREVWHQEVVKNRFYSSPLVVDGIVYLITRNYDLLALDAASGNLHYEQKIKGLTGTAYPSLTLVGDVILAGADDGKVAFVKPGKTFEEIGRTEVGPFRSTPIFAGGMGYLRTLDSLMAIRGR